MQVFIPFSSRSRKVSLSLSTGKKTSLPNNSVRNHLVWQTLRLTCKWVWNGMKIRAMLAFFFIRSLTHSLDVNQVCFPRVFSCVSGGRTPKSTSSSSPSPFHTQTSETMRMIALIAIWWGTESHRISFILLTLGLVIFSFTLVFCVLDTCPYKHYTIYSMPVLLHIFWLNRQNKNEINLRLWSHSWDSILNGYAPLILFWKEWIVMAICQPQNKPNWIDIG